MSELIEYCTELGRPWMGEDPFLFCMHHLDRFPTSDGQMGVSNDALGRRELGADFSAQDGFSMYYGDHVPGFPVHPHRGFETVSIVRRGYVDHSDSLGARARYGQGDVQWLTAGGGVQHAEMFPLLDINSDNTLELFQIWLNLPARNKMVPAAFKMLWAESLPHFHQQGAHVQVIAGAFSPEGAALTLTPPSPPPDGWGSDPASGMAIWLVQLEPDARITLPAASQAQTQRSLYVFAGDGLHIENSAVGAAVQLGVTANAALPLHNRGQSTVELLLLQAVPLQEPVVAAGPFVMNTEAEIEQARRDYVRTQYGGWPWPERGPVHPAGQSRFAQYPDGRMDLPPGD